jgi:hypothetical protein
MTMTTPTMNDELPPWLSTKEAALQVALWLMRQPDRTWHQMSVLCELGEFPDYIRDMLLSPPWQCEKP